MAGFARGPAFRLVARVRLEIRSLTRPLAILLAAGGVGTLYTNDSNSAPQPAIENPDERKLVTAVRKSLERKEAGQTNPEVTRIERGSIVVELVCHTEQSFLRFMEDFETGKIKDKLEEEFGNIDVTIINRDEVQQNVNAIRFERVKRAVCSIECIEEGGEVRGRGTGFYYGGGWIMTVAHNLRDPNKDNETSHSWLSEGKFRVSFDIGGEHPYEFAKFQEKRMAFFHHLKPRGKSADLKNKDIGMVKLGRQWEWGREENDYSQWETEENEKLEQMKYHFSPLVQTDAPHAEEGDNAYAVYYVGDKKEVEKVKITRISKGAGEVPMLHLEKNPGVLPAGASGCPVLIEKDSKHHLLGLHFAGSDDESYGEALALQWKHGIEDFLKEGVSIIAEAEAYMAKSSQLAREHTKLFEKEVNDSESDLKSKAKKAKLSIYLPNGKVFKDDTSSS